MKKEDLINLSLDEETVGKVLKLYTEELKNYISLDKFNELKEEKELIENSIKERDRQLDELKKVDTGKLREEIEKLQEENKANTEAYEASIKQMKTDYAVEKALINSKARNIKAVKPFIDMEKVKLNENGELEGLDIESIKKSEPYLFDSIQEKQEGTGFTPGINQTVNLEKMTYTEMCKYLEQNPQAQI